MIIHILLKIVTIAACCILFAGIFGAFYSSFVYKLDDESKHAYIGLVLGLCVVTAGFVFFGMP